LRVLRLEVSVYNVYITNLLETTLEFSLPVIITTAVPLKNHLAGVLATPISDSPIYLNLDQKI
jgi:hypothetical protein